MKHELIARLGLALYGEAWQAAMARELDVSRSTVQDWRQGRMQPPAGVLDDLLQIVMERRAALDALAAEINRRK